MKFLLLLVFAAALVIASNDSDAKPSGGKGGGSKSHASRAHTGSPMSVRGHVTKRGSYVQPHKRSAPDKSKSNNYSTKGNVNPYTGKPGTADPSKK